MTDLHQIVPPYLLRHLAAGSEPIAGQARSTLNRDARTRRARVATPIHAGMAIARPGATGPARAVSDAGNSTTLPGRPARTEGDPATGDPATDEAYDGFGATWRFFAEVFDRDSIDGAGMDLLGTVHYGTSYQNAFWNGERMVFGDGDGEVFGRFTASLEVIAHELCHAVVAHTADLTYRSQSGALNESVCDVFGVLVAQHAAGQTAAAADWLVGADLLLPGVGGVALRSMLHPGTAYDDPRLGTDPQPAHMSGYVRTREDNGGVHYNSGIPNRAFALAATTIGGHAWEQAGRVWYDVLSGDAIRPDCDFATFADLTIAAAVARYGEGAEAEAIRAAWREVGVDPAVAAPPGGEGEQLDPNAQLLLRRTGGVAGVARERRTTLAALPGPDRRAWASLLAGQELARFAGAGRELPDAFCYGVVCRDAGVDVVVPEPVLPTSLRALFERTLRGG